MYAYTYACACLFIYLFPYKERFPKRTREQGHLPWAECAKAFLVVSGDQRLLQILFAEKQPGPFVLQGSFPWKTAALA